jgi:hypothetical protein
VLSEIQINASKINYTENSTKNKKIITCEKAVVVLPYN